ncbi:hypothetical protein FOIG_12198 [Fusarium odoratissimum NRRL 54006]|uniref:Uncharacterized protein n=2 Tax=Fusarium oxysporum species complex TaxID=171631 RepID=X0KE31_FUSO5|nr:uncharacterized protein FOIG_12198 [Fusarium odoratissimum NRRL 54006]EXL95219.1 hypothetical protein FOIG_12198 [Fusarium odoratissimum NRRL 54006]TXC10615.1 hypothetical protein FocTR4_00005328 [Fusarium oxysporum f. sp. cubense]
MHENKSNWVKFAGLFNYVQKGFDEQGSKRLTISFTSSYKRRQETRNLPPNFYHGHWLNTISHRTRRLSASLIHKSQGPEYQQPVESCHDSSEGLKDEGYL